jgi:hypothetical protein
MRITPFQELAVVGALIAYISFTNGFQAVRSLLATPVGKAVGLAVIAGVWKYGSPLIALFLAINFVRCAGMREGLENAETYVCPEGTTPKTDMPGKCAKMVNGMEILVDGTASGTASSTPPPAVTVPEALPPPPTTIPSTVSSTTTAATTDTTAGATAEPFGTMSSTTSFSPV